MVLFDRCNAEIEVEVEVEVQMIEVRAVENLDQILAFRWTSGALSYLATGRDSLGKRV